ncbi:MAG: hypothetical protein K8S99_06840 [Planctomycetes bacterium]|nr:hypothetical protein [Planctomycetota bacterium]
MAFGDRSRNPPAEPGAMGRSAAWLLCVIALTLAGCASHNKSAATDNTIDLGPPPPRKQIRPPDPAQTQPHRTFRIHVQRADVARGERLDKAWSLVRIPLGDAALERWDSNGLRAGLLETAQLAAFSRQLPKRLNEERQMILTPEGRDAVLAAAPPLNRKTIIEWAEDDGQTRPLLLQPGQPQFLLSVAAQPDGLLRVTFTPHLYYRVATLLPQTPDEFDHSGRVFTELAMSMMVDKDHALVLAVVPPPPIEGPPAATQPETQPADPAATQPVATLPPPPPPLRLGDVLLAARRLKSEVQSVLVISVTEE